MDPIDKYVDQLKATQRPIVRQRCLQTACNTLPPGDLTRLYLCLTNIGGPELCELAPYYKYMTARRRRRAALQPQLQAMQPVGSGQIYQTPRFEKREKRLYILFSGQTGQFFIPLAMLLYLLPKGPKDVLVIRSGKDIFYRYGINGMGVTPFEVGTAIKRLYSTQAYKHISVLGFSAGGFYAFRIAEFLNAQVGLSFAGVHRIDALNLPEMQQVGATAFDPLCMCRTQTNTRLINVIGSKNEYDTLASHRAKKVRPRMIQYHLTNSHRHDVLKQLAKRGTAQLFFRLALGDSGFGIRLVALPLGVLGALVRRFRLLKGSQKVQSWYLKAAG